MLAWHMTWYLYQRIILILLPLCLGDGGRLNLSSSQKSSILITLPILSAWLLANQHFIKQVQETKLFSVQDHCSTALT